MWDSRVRGSCLWEGAKSQRPSEAKELPLIEDWSPTIGAWQPSAARWPRGLKFVLDQIRQAGMVPGLWLEPEVAGVKSLLAKKTDNWFLARHGKRVLKNSRFLLDLRNPEVRSYLDEVIERLVNQYGVGYIKMDYNVDSLPWSIWTARR